MLAKTLKPVRFHVLYGIFFASSKIPHYYTDSTCGLKPKISFDHACIHTNQIPDMLFIYILVNKDHFRIIIVLIGKLVAVLEYYDI